MIFEQIRVDGDRNLAYLIGDGNSKRVAIVDASYAPERVLERVQHHGMELCYIISTHSHPDHIAGNGYLVERTAAPEVLHESTPHPCSVRAGREQIADRRYSFRRKGRWYRSTFSSKRPTPAVGQPASIDASRPIY